MVKNLVTTGHWLNLHRQFKNGKDQSDFEIRLYGGVALLRQLFCRTFRGRCVIQNGPNQHVRNVQQIVVN